MRIGQLAGLIGSFFILSVGAQAQERGRLEDGRAYRVGADGFRLVDEIAELQVSNDDLRKQVARLQTQLEGGEDTCSTMPPAAIDQSNPPSCDELVSNLYLRISRLENQNSANGLPAAAVCDFESERNPYLKQLRAANQREDVAKQEIARLSEQVISGQAAISEKEQIIAQLEKQQSVSKELLAKAEAKARSPQVASKPAAIEPQGETRRARMQRAASPVVQAKGYPALDPLDSARLSLNQELKKTSSLIGKRKSYYDKLRKTKGMSSFQLQRLETARGMSLDSIRRQVKRMKAVEQAAALHHGLDEIQNLLNKDIAVLRKYLK